MKRFISLAMASLFIGSVFFTGCAGLDTDTDENTSSATSSNAVSEEYGAVAKAVTDALNAEFATKDEAKAFLNNFSEDDETEEFNSSIDSLVSDGTINATVASYVKKVNAALDNANTFAEAMSNIDAVEKEAQSNLSGDDLTAVMSSAETTRATFAYFNDIENDGTARRWGWIKRRVQKIATSAGTGAVVGAITGGVSGAITGGVAGALSGAATGAATGAAAGAIKGATE